MPPGSTLAPVWGESKRESDQDGVTLINAEPRLLSARRASHTGARAASPARLASRHGWSWFVWLDEQFPKRVKCDKTASGRSLSDAELIVVCEQGMMDQKKGRFPFGSERG